MSDKNCLIERFFVGRKSRFAPELREDFATIQKKKLLFRQNPNCNTTFIAENLGEKISNRTIERDVSSLRSKGVIDYQGQKKGGGYTVCHISVVEIT